MNIDYVLVGAGILVSIGIVVLILARRPYYHKHVRLSDVRMYLGVLLKRGYDGGFVTITDMRSNNFIQFAKYIKEEGNMGLELSFPKAPWSEEYYDRLRDFLRGQGIPFAIQPVTSVPVAEFMNVDCGSDIDLAFRLVEGISHDIFELREGALFRISFSNVSVKDELIVSKGESR